MKHLLLLLWAFFLQNPSFEPPYIQLPHRAIPPGWTIVQLPDEREVETGPIGAPYYYRVYDGTAALKVINPFAPMHAWISQRVFIPGKYHVRFSVMVHGWYVADVEPPRLEGDIPVSSDPVSQACAFISPDPPPLPPCGLQVVNDLPYKKVEATTTTDTDGWWWVGVYLESPPGRNNDFYVDAASLEVESAIITPIPEQLNPRTQEQTQYITPTPCPSPLTALPPTPSPIPPSPTPENPTPESTPTPLPDSSKAAPQPTRSYFPPLTGGWSPYPSFLPPPPTRPTLSLCSFLPALVWVALSAVALLFLLGRRRKS